MKRILLCGNSVLIAGLNSCLQDNSEFEIHWLEDLTASMEFNGFKTIVTDNNCLVSDDFFAQFNDQPNLQLVCLDAEAGTLTTLEGFSYPVRSINEILQWLNKYGEV